MASEKLISYYGNKILKYYNEIEELNDVINRYIADNTTSSQLIKADDAIIKISPSDDGKSSINIVDRMDCVEKFNLRYSELENILQQLFIVCKEKNILVEVQTFLCNYGINKRNEMKKAVIMDYVKLKSENMTDDEIGFLMKTKYPNMLKNN